MRTIHNEDNWYWLAGLDEHGAIIAMDENSVRVLIQTARHPGKHVSIGLDEFDHLVEFVNDNRDGIIATILRAKDKEVAGDGCK